MRRRTFARLLGGGALFEAATGPELFGQQPPAPPEQPEQYVSASPFAAGNRAQLFVNQMLVREAKGVAFTLHPAEKHAQNPLIKADQPWEGWRVQLYGNVIYDFAAKLYKMWYVGDTPEFFPGIETPTLYATSVDGIHWEKPLVGTLPARQGGKHNAVAPGCLASVMKDEADPDPEKLYKMICYISRSGPGKGYRTMTSPDGLQWTTFSKTRICPALDVITGFYDEQRRMYVAYAKMSGPFRGHRRRLFHLITSRDFVNWTAPELAFYPDLQDDAGSLARIEKSRFLLDLPDDPAQMRTEFYGAGFYLAESCTIGFPWVFTINNRTSKGIHTGPFELQLAVSRDLRHWERPLRTPCLAPGRPGEWDCGLITTQSRALRVGDEVWLYYSGANYAHGASGGAAFKEQGARSAAKPTCSIGLAKWKLDRFVSAGGPGEGGTLTTVPVVFSGERLEINARTKPHGTIRVELLDPAGLPVEGWGASDPFRGDSLRSTVTWRGNTRVAALQGKPVTLRFRLQGAELFSFAFREKA